MRNEISGMEEHSKEFKSMVDELIRMVAATAAMQEIVTRSGRRTANTAGQVHEHEWVLGQERAKDSNMHGSPLRCSWYEGEGDDSQPIRSPPDAYPCQQPRMPPSAHWRTPIPTSTLAPPNLHLY